MYYKDQDAAKAFETFLQALDEVPLSLKASEVLDAEKKVYDEALKIYLDPQERNPEYLSLKIKDLYSGIVRLHPNFYNFRIPSFNCLCEFKSILLNSLSFFIPHMFTFPIISCV